MIWLLATAILISQLSEEEGVRRVQAHLLIEDPQSALSEAQELASSSVDALN